MSYLLTTLTKKREVDSIIRFDFMMPNVSNSMILTADHTKWIGEFHRKQDFVYVVEAIFRGAMKGKLIVSCPLPPERIPRFQLQFKDV
ncbi:hypothetical protein MKW92_018538 [Papaver armeniacum]|nr:hypothetical protein MKW92_018538 [Papaver armeniacum]